MTAAFQASVTVNGDIGLLEAFKQQINTLLSEESAVQNFREQYISQDLIYRFEANQGIPFPLFVTTSAAFPDLKIKVEWINHRDGVSGSALIQNGKLADQHTRSLADSERISSPLQLDIEVEENGYLRQAIVFKNIGPSEYAGYFLTGKQHALFKIRKRDNQAELYASDGLDTEWAEHWTYNLESRSNGYQELAPREKIEDGLYQVMQALVDDFVDEWVWFAESPPENIIIEQQKYERMGLATHQANIKAEKIRKMDKGNAGRGNSYGFSTLSNDCAWIKTVVVECWAGK
ncbi:MAG TPA: hypothetical protein VHE58_10085 [Burkholderiales bacterium]|nr:hypothetical protein [Burkholderiales bacterium]